MMIDFSKRINEILKENDLDYKSIRNMKYESDNSIDAYYSSIQYCHSFCKETILPSIKSLLKTSESEKAIQGIFYRMFSLTSSILNLNQVIHFQSIISSTRTLFELFLDSELLINNHVSNGIKKYFEFIEVQKLKMAKKVTNFYKSKNFDFDYTKHENFIKNNEYKITNNISELWGTRKNGKIKFPEHWTNLNTADRVNKIDNYYNNHEIEDIYVQIFAHFSWYIHSDPTAIHGFDDKYFKNLIAICYMHFFKLHLKSLKTICVFLKIDKTYKNFGEILNNINQSVSVFLLEFKLKNKIT